MADRRVESRVAKALKSTWEASAKSEHVWDILAKAAIAEAKRTVDVAERPLPESPYLCLQRPVRSDGMRVIAQSSKLEAAKNAGTYYLLETGEGSIIVAEIKAVLQLV